MELPSCRSILSETNKFYKNAQLIDESRKNYCDLLDLIDAFEKFSEEYILNPSLDRLFKMAEIIYPISKTTSEIYCKMILETCPFHTKAQVMLKNIDIDT